MEIVANLELVHNNISKLMQLLYGDRLAKIILYGSYARGDYHSESDIDYLIVLCDEQVSSFREVATTRPALNKVFDDTGIDISTVVVSNKQLQNSGRLFYRQVRKDGKCIYERRSEQLHKEGRSLSIEC